MFSYIHLGFDKNRTLYEYNYSPKNKKINRILKILKNKNKKAWWIAFK